MKTVSKIPILLLILCVSLLSIDKNAGTAGAQFLKLGVGANQLARGSAAVAVDNGAEAIFWNPATLRRSQNIQFATMVQQWMQGIKHGFISAATPWKKSYSLIGGISYIDYGMMHITDMEHRSDPIGEFKPRTVVLSGSIIDHSPPEYLRLLGMKLYIPTGLIYGITLKGFYDEIEQYTSYGGGIDIGILYLGLVKGMDFGVLIRNMGYSTAYDVQRDKLPFSINIGSRYVWTATKSDIFDFSATIEVPNDNQMKLHLGVEYYFKKLIYFRGGYITGSSGNLALQGLTAGLGISYKDYRIDYAIIPFDDLGYTHSVSFNISVQNYLAFITD